MNPRAGGSWREGWAWYTAMLSLLGEVGLAQFEAKCRQSIMVIAAHNARIRSRFMDERGRRRMTASAPTEAARATDARHDRLGHGRSRLPAPPPD